MSNMRHCPHCHCSTEIVKIGTASTHRQRYRCKQCHKTWTSKPHPNRLKNAIWYDYAVEDLRIEQLCRKYGYGDDKLRSILHNHQVPPIPSIIPAGKHGVLSMDCTYFGRRGINEWGLLIIIDAITSVCLYCEEIPGHETYAHYIKALKYLRDYYGIWPKVCVIDGVTGLAGILREHGILVQYCQFHQIKTVIGYLTRNPVLEPNIELKSITLQLTQVNRRQFAKLFSDWLDKYRTWLMERTINPDTHKLEYTHQRTRSAVRSIQNNFDFLYTFEQYPELHIPNTNNRMEGINSAIKHKLNHHRGAKKDLKVKLIRTFLSRRTGV